MSLRRILGVVIAATAILGIVLSVAGIVYGRRAIDDVSRNTGRGLDLALQSLDAGENTLGQARAILAQINDGLATAETAAVDVSQAISQTRPLVGEIAEVVSQDVPDAIEAAQTSLDEMAEVAGMVDQTLATLSDLRVEQQILGVPLRFELNLGYAPEVPLQESVGHISTSLEPLPPRLRALAVHTATTDSSLATVSRNSLAMASDLAAIRGALAEADPLFDEYTATMGEARTLVEEAGDGLARRRDGARLVLTLVMAWMGLAQLAPLYVGWQLLAGRNGSE